MNLIEECEEIIKKKSGRPRLREINMKIEYNKEYNKNYYRINKDKLQENSKKHCELCQCGYSSGNNISHLKSRKHINNSIIKEFNSLKEKLNLLKI